MRSTPSSEPFLDSRRWTEAVAASDGLRTLTRGLTRAQGFTLFFAVCNKPVERDQLITMLGQALPGILLHQVELTGQAMDILTELGQRYPKPQGPVLIVNLEKAVPSDVARHEILKNLNLQRPQWPQQVQQPVVFWVPQYVLGFIEREAPDFFDWRSDTVTFPELEVEEVDHLRRFAWTPAVDGSLTKEARLARIQELRTRLKETPTSDDPVAKSARANWLHELASQLAFTGEGVDEAIQLYQEAHRLYEAIGNKQSLAITLGDIARIRTVKGEVDAALQLHQEEIAIYEALGDRRSWAMALGDIARIRAAKGELDAALQLYQERLGIFEAIGDKRSRASTLCDIARIREAKGDMDQALQLHQENLKICRELGDKRGEAVAMGDIARIRADKGEVDAALQLHQERLGIYEALGDLEGKANAIWRIARIEVQRRQWQEAFDHLAESYGITLKLGHLEGICHAGLDLGQVLAKTGNREEGLKVLTRSHDGFLKLGRIKMARKTQAIIDEISKSSS